MNCGEKVEKILKLEHMGFPYDLSEFFCEHENSNVIVLIDELLYQFEDVETEIKDLRNFYININKSAKFFSTYGYTTNQDSYSNSDFIEYDNNLILVLNEILNDNIETRIIILTNCDFISYELVKILKQMLNRRYEITIRLFSKRIASLWNTLNFTLNYKLNILEDYNDERKKVNRINPDLKYTIYLHKMRECGIDSILIDDVSRRRLTQSETLFINKLTKKTRKILCFPSIC